MDFFTILPAGIAYLIPLVPLAILFWYQQNWCARINEAAESIKTKHSALDVAKSVLQAAKIEGVDVEPWDNHSETLFDSEKSKVFLSASIHGENDISAIAHAIHAIGHAIMETQKNEMYGIKKITGPLFSVLFWCVFGILAFGLMSASLPVVIAGYIVCLVCIGLQMFNQWVGTTSDRLALEYLVSLGMLEEGNIAELRKTLRSVTLKW